MNGSSWVSQCIVLFENHRDFRADVLASRALQCPGMPVENTALDLGVL